jgi:hypothetical protein
LEVVSASKVNLEAAEILEVGPDAPAGFEPDDIACRAAQNQIACPAPGGPTSTSLGSSTSGPPARVIMMAFDIPDRQQKCLG